ncbi:hypothetical protein D3C79_809710 [compost metagenome]
MQNRINGIRLRTSIGQVKCSAWVAAPVVAMSGRTSRPSSCMVMAITMMLTGMVNKPAMIPKAMYLWSTLRSMASPTGITKMIVEPDWKPVISPSIQPSGLCARALANW